MKKIMRCPLKGRMGQCSVDGWCSHVNYNTYSEAEELYDCSCEPRKCVISVCDEKCQYCEDMPKTTLFDNLLRLLSRPKENSK